MNTDISGGASSREKSPSKGDTKFKMQRVAVIEEEEEIPLSRKKKSRAMVESDEEDIGAKKGLKRGRPDDQEENEREVNKRKIVLKEEKKVPDSSPLKKGVSSKSPSPSKRLPS
jgi:hypothetical protein